jgi:GT2 family glycosyltransferase
MAQVMSGASDKAVCIVVLGFNHAEYTLACLETLFLLDPPATWVIVVDNASTDNTVEQVRHRGAKAVREGTAASFDEHAAALSEEAASLASSLARHSFRPATRRGLSADTTRPALYLLRSPFNKGYAGGNNLGIALALSLGADAVWILNNDATVDKAALGAMRERLFSKSRPGLCGSLVLYADSGQAGQVVQCRGGGFTHRWTMLSKLNARGMSLSDARADTPEKIERELNFIYGASVMASRAFIERIGLMDENYFMYCEEQDWAFRAGGRFDLAYAPDALVRHREGGTTGHSRACVNIRALLRLMRSRLLLAWKHAPYALPVVGCGILFAAARMLPAKCAVAARRISNAFEGLTL